MVHLIAFELRGYRSARSVSGLGNAIRAISGTWFHLSDRMYFIETERSTRDVAAGLAPYTRAGDSLFVTRIYRDWNAYGLTNEQITWLNARNFGSLADSLQHIVASANVGRPITFSPNPSDFY